MNEQNTSTALAISDSHQLQLNDPQMNMRRATDIASICKEIVKRTAKNIQGRKFVPVEGWQSIASTYGCVLSARDTERVDGGIRAVADVRRMSDGVVLASAEGFVGEDEPTWYGGGPKNLPKRAEYAIRAMASTRAMSRAARTAFAFVVVLMDAGLQTTPAEEVPDGGFHDDSNGHSQPRQEQRTEQRQEKPANATAATTQPEQGKSDNDAPDWREAELHFGKNKGSKLGDIDEGALKWWVETWFPKPFPEGSKTIKASDLYLRQQLDQAAAELGMNPAKKAA